MNPPPPPPTHTHTHKHTLLHNHSNRVITADAAQGREWDAVVISMVRSNTQGRLGFLCDPHRTCVMLSRARYVLRIVGMCVALFSFSRSLFARIEANVSCV